MVYTIQVGKLTWVSIFVAWKQKDQKAIDHCKVENIDPNYAQCQYHATSNESHWRWLTRCSTFDFKYMENDSSAEQ